MTMARTALRRRIDPEALARFRQTGWANIRRELRDAFGVAEADLSEPEWEVPGQAYFWQESTLRQVVEGPKGREWKETPTGWERIGPLTCDSAGQVASYLQRGLRFRPPTGDSESVDEASETRLAASAPSRTFVCKHGAGDKDNRLFPTWKGYLRHCVHFNEPLQEKPPDEVLEMAAGYKWFCFLHDVGFNESQHRAMEQHMRIRKIQAAGHPALFQKPDGKKTLATLPVKEARGAMTASRGPNKSSAGNGT